MFRAARSASAQGDSGMGDASRFTGRRRDSAVLVGIRSVRRVRQRVAVRRHPQEVQVAPDEQVDVAAGRAVQRAGREQAQRAAAGAGVGEELQLSPG